jgi:serine/threonine-protein kinase
MVASREPNDTAKPGTVIRQSAPAGQRVPRETPVTVVLADEVLKVANVSGLTLAAATQKLEQQGYQVQVGATTAHPTIAQGLVMDQSPKAATAQAKGSSVTLTVSAGPGDVEIPKLLGVAVPQAKSDLEKLGLKPVVIWVAMAETDTFVVLSQKPAAGQKVKPGSEVKLTANQP